MKIRLPHDEYMEKLNQAAICPCHFIDFISAYEDEQDEPWPMTILFEKEIH
jgi:hypothetical protein